LPPDLPAAPRQCVGQREVGDHRSLSARRARCVQEGVIGRDITSNGLITKAAAATYR
jgi:hypothetical protein